MPHTPGPWTVESLDNVDFTVLGGKSGQVRIAVESSERDARLIAAAPDLLAALQNVLDLLSREQAEVVGAQVIARAAIAHATVE